MFFELFNIIEDILDIIEKSLVRRLVLHFLAEN